MMEFHPQPFEPPTQKMIIANAEWQDLVSFVGIRTLVLGQFVPHWSGGLRTHPRLDIHPKSAREILEAIVNRLVTAKKKPESAEFKALGSPSKDHLDCVVKDIARNISRLQVTTIDGFVNRLFERTGMILVSRRVAYW